MSRERAVYRASFDFASPEERETWLDMTGNGLRPDRTCRVTIRPKADAAPQSGPESVAAAPAEPKYWPRCPLCARRERCAKCDAAPAPVDIEAEAEILKAVFHGRHSSNGSETWWRAVAQYVAEREAKLREDLMRALGSSAGNEDRARQFECDAARYKGELEAADKHVEILRTQLAESEAARKKAEENYATRTRQAENANKCLFESDTALTKERATVTALETERDEAIKVRDDAIGQFRMAREANAHLRTELSALRAPLSDAQIKAGAKAIQEYLPLLYVDAQEACGKAWRAAFTAVRGVPSEPVKPAPIGSLRATLDQICGENVNIDKAEGWVRQAIAREPVKSDQRTCHGEWTSGSGAHRMHGAPCSAPAEYVDVDGLYAYCAKHVPREPAEPAAWTDAFDKERLAAGREGGK